MEWIFGVVAAFSVLYAALATASFREQFSLMTLQILSLEKEKTDLEFRLGDCERESEDLAEARVASARLTREVAELERKAQDEARKGGELFKTIESVLKERDGWRDLYFVEATEHGNAQRQLLEERSRLVKQLQKAGVKPAVSPAIERIVNEFSEKHTVDPEQYKEAKQKTT